MDPDALGRFSTSWHGIGLGRRGLETLLDAVEQLQGAAIPASVLEHEILAARVADYHPAMLDTLMAAGEVIWVGVEPLGERDGRIALYLTDHFERLRSPQVDTATPGGRAEEVLTYLRKHGASFFASIHQGTGGGFPKETVDALWELVWRGAVTNDTLHPLRAYGRAEGTRASKRARSTPFRSRRLVPTTAEGRWTPVTGVRPSKASHTGWATATAQQLLTRHGVITRETVASESVSGGFSAVYQVLKAMEEAGKIRRGYFVAGLGAAQFAQPAALDLLRSLRDIPDEPRTAVMAATDPANPYGAIVKWPDIRGEAPATEPRRAPTRSVGALVILVDGFAAGYLRRGERELLLFTPDTEPLRSRLVREVARVLLWLAASREEGRRGMLIAEINGVPATTHVTARLFLEEGFATTAMGLQARTERLRPRGFGADGTRIATPEDGGVAMTSRKPTPASPRQREQQTNEVERERLKEHKGIEPDGPEYEDDAKGLGDDVDPDSAESEVDRDDTLDE